MLAQQKRKKKFEAFRSKEIGKAAKRCQTEHLVKLNNWKQSLAKISDQGDSLMSFLTSSFLHQTAVPISIRDTVE